MEIQIRIIGVLLMILASIHVIFPRYFNWESELKSLSLINKQMMVVHTFFVALTVFLMGLLCFTNSSELVGTPLGKTLCLGIGVFWTIRLFIQFFGYSSKLWQGKTFETIVHIIFSFFWLYLSVVFLMVYFSNTIQ